MSKIRTVCRYCGYEYAIPVITWMLRTGSKCPECDSVSGVKEEQLPDYDVSGG